MYDKKEISHKDLKSLIDEETEQFRNLPPSYSLHVSEKHITVNKSVKCG